MKNKYLKLSTVLVLLSNFYFCTINLGQNKLMNINTNKETRDLKAPEWVANAVIYEVNIRQYSSEGTINEFRKSLPRLRKMGIDILWFMPIHPIGEKNRKGSKGSYYSIKNYTEINQEFGTKEDFRACVEEAHALGFRVIMDWVANHTSFDHSWTKLHPDWYMYDAKGNMLHPADNEGKLTDWVDVADLNYSMQDMRNQMILDMLYWVQEFQIDGFRCDVVGFIPVDFWDDCRKALNRIAAKNIYLLAEDETPAYTKNAFNTLYGWEMHQILKDVAMEKKGPKDILNKVAKDQNELPPFADKMNFIDNHDENSWHGTVNERFGKAYKSYAVLTFTLPGIPLIYSGQEGNLDKVLQFFEKDEINFNQYKDEKFYTQLCELKHKNSALYANYLKGEFIPLDNNHPQSVLSFIRKSKINSNQILVIVNFSSKRKKVKINETKFLENKSYVEIFTKSKINFDGKTTIDLEPNYFKVFVTP